MNDRDRDPEPTEEDGEMARLFGLAGPRPALPDAEVAPIKEEARRAWRAHLEHRRARARRRPFFLAAAAVLALAAGAALVLYPSSGAGPTLATIEASAGGATLDGAPAAFGAALRRGAVLSTGADGRVALRLAGGVSLRLDAASAVRLGGASSARLERGAIYVDSGATAVADGLASPEGAVEIETALGTVRDVGTQFEVRLLEDEALRVRVREGTVAVESDGRREIAESGSELLVDARGETRRGVVAAQGEAWGWAERAAAPIAIEGTRLGAFLDWAARETGRRWRFAGGVPPATADVLLHGSLAGLTPAEALEVVLPGCGLRHRTDGADLVVEPAGPRQAIPLTSPSGSRTTAGSRPSSPASR